MTRLFRLKRRKDETWFEYHTRICNMAKEDNGKQMDPPFLYEKKAGRYCGAPWCGYAMKRRKRLFSH